MKQVHNSEWINQLDTRQCIGILSVVDTKTGERSIYVGIGRGGDALSVEADEKLILELGTKMSPESLQKIIRFLVGFP